ncbi:TolC family protein [Lysobacter sp. BMK333-48F3]|uniref:TolC family protein n=1 Tax=Lysobacter sp. BMK333-48F3 TaxID=2867962 RepID=UPI001C8BBB2A|nr:TolC family protein [Lysobacter sp. BMK333-48F3]MBX9400417.1 TolC family protein [Lysobacter sp. BMK333-48F3]
MWLRPAALAVLTAALCLSAQAQPRPALSAPKPEPAAPRPASVFTLDDALARIGQAHPDLRMFGGQRDVLLAERDRAAQTPPWMVGVAVDNVLGSGAVAGAKAAEVTLSLASVFERGGKLDARRAVAQSRIDALAVDREGRRLDLLAEAARRYLAIVAAQRGIELAQFDIGQRKRAVAAARQRLQAGASPESGLLTAQAALARAELDRRRSEQSLLAARQHLAALWGERDPGFANVAGDPYALPAIQDATALAGLLDRTPELARFADQARIAEARLRLAQTEAAPDLSWQVGLRRLQDGSDFGLVGSVSMPLGARRRAEPGIRGAQAELALLETEREAKGLSLYSTLVEAHGRYRVGALEVARLQDEVLPRLVRAEAAADYAYRAGAIGYLELALLQAESVAVRRQRLDAAVAAQLALIEIQRLTGEGFLAASSAEPAGAAR